MSDTPKFTVVDRRKFRSDEQAAATPTAEASEQKPVDPLAESAASLPAPAAGPRLITMPEPKSEPVPDTARKPAPEPVETPQLGQAPSGTNEAEFGDPDLPPIPTVLESREQKQAYDASAERLDDLLRAQNPGMPRAEKIGFAHLTQQLYLSAMMQMGAGTPEGQRPRIDIVGARVTIDLVGVLAEKTRGNLTAEEDRVLQTCLYELRMAFLELTSMISLQAPPAVPVGAPAHGPRPVGVGGKGPNPRGHNGGGLR